MAASVRRVFALPAKLKENKDSYRYSSYSKNLIAVHEDCLFVWHAVEEHILVVTLKEKRTSEDEEPQILTLSNPPAFTVEELKFSPCGHHLALTGKNGVMVVELPRRWGSTQYHGAGFEGGKDIVLCKSWKIAQRFLSCNRHVQVCYVDWYPGHSSSSHILVLCSDNHLRLYNVTDYQTPVACIPLGDSDPTVFNSFSRVSFPHTAAALGDTAVSFDFGPAFSPDEGSVSSEADLIWPIFILKGNGDICLINSNVKNMRGRGPRVQGPLTMHPPAEDNYGADACSIACLQTVPPVLVVATCAGILYHCLALRNPDSSQLLDDEGRSNQTWNPLEEKCDVDLYVFESVELSISLVQPEPEDELFSCPIRLSLDPSVMFRYHCTHSAGVHAVVLQIIPQIEKFFSREEENVCQDALQEILDSTGRESVVEHLVCSQPFPSAPANPILGLAVSNTTSGSYLVCLMSTWDALLLPLGTSLSNLRHAQFLEEDSAQEDESKPEGRGERAPDSLLSGFLASFQGSGQTPVLKTDPSGTEPSTQKCIELLGNITQSLREDRIQRLQIAHTQMQKRVNMLKDQKVQMLTELAMIGSEQETLRANAEALAEKYEDVSHKQQVITKKVECALSLLQRRMPVLSDAEISMQKELHGVEERLKHLENLLQQAQLKMKFKTDMENVRNQLNNARNTEQLNNSNQIKHVRELITQQGNSVSNLVRKVNFMMKEMSL